MDDQRLAAILRGLRSFSYIDLSDADHDADEEYLEIAQAIASALDGKRFEEPGTTQEAAVEDDIARILKAAERIGHQGPEATRDAYAEPKEGIIWHGELGDAAGNSWAFELPERCAECGVQPRHVNVRREVALLNCGHQVTGRRV